MASSEASEMDSADEQVMNTVDDILANGLNDSRRSAPRVTDGDTATASESDSDGSSEGSVIEAVVPARSSVPRSHQAPLEPRASQFGIRIPPPPKRPWTWIQHDTRLKRILKELEKDGSISYVVETHDKRRLKLSFQQITSTPEGCKLLNSHQSPATSEAEIFTKSKIVMQPRQARVRAQVNFIDRLGDSDDEDELSSNTPFAARPSKPRPSYADQLTDAGTESEDDEEKDDDEEDRDGRPRRRKRTLRGKYSSASKAPERATRQTRVSQKPRVHYDYGALASAEESQSSPGRKRKRRRIDTFTDADIRRSGRQRISRTMREVGENEIDEIEVQQSTGPKANGAKEAFKKLEPQNEFRKRHSMICDTCFGMGDSPDRGGLIFCQGCTMSYHRACLGHRTNREHLVTKVGDGDFVMQCRRCVEVPRKKDKTAPHHGRCSSCKKAGSASRPFRPRKSPSEEQKDREANDGEDPSFFVPPQLLNNAENILFRCRMCFQAYHLHHLPSKQSHPLEGNNITQKSSHRFAEYSETWTCHECEDRPALPHGPGKRALPGTLIAWRPIPTANYISGQTVEKVNEDDKEYLVKWQNMSHYKCMWKPGAWVWGVVPVSTRKAFAQKENNIPTMTTEDAIPEEWLRIDIIFSVKYNNYVQANIEEVDIARIKEVGRVFAKFKGLGYEDAVWTDPPDQEETERYEDFWQAYVDYIRGKYLRMPTTKRVANELQKLRPTASGDAAFNTSFENKVLLTARPAGLSGGELMKYQLDGVNWMLFQWMKEHNGILGDEMGLGKTIQVVGLLTALKENHNLFPFLIVVPNATCANWRRELQKWAPGLRVVTYFGSARAKELSMQYELFGDRGEHTGRSVPSGQDLRCHVVVTSYEAAAEQECQAFFKKINWQALIVDEGQRLKNDKTQLYAALMGLKTPFRLLLTGTPLQNNVRELFNLLHFLDKNLDAEIMAKEYEVLNKDLVKELHTLIKPFFLRRTKAEVLDFLPPMGQVIVPVTMTKLQKELYKNVLSKNAELVKSVMGKRNNDRGKAITGLRNVLMQLRKVLCHPFVYSLDIEEETRDHAVSHRRLVAASAKLILLELMLPKLRERGHRVLIFSQFLDNLTMVEDFLTGMEMPHLRLDGTQGSLEKQKKIDAFNAPDSNIFCMLLSTRAGGVGINLATADTVIILDPDFNPHQDVQAISRAHRIGQKNKVLVFKLMTRDSAEEKIMQVGKKKMALDQAIIEQINKDDDGGQDLEGILAFGAKALFEDDTTDITYDEASIEKLLDRSQIENTKIGEDGEATTASQFGWARIWQNESGKMGPGFEDTGREGSADSALWDTILDHRAKAAEEEKKRKEQELGRGRRNRAAVHYGQDIVQNADNDSDTDFADKESGQSEDEHDSQMSGIQTTVNPALTADVIQLDGASTRIQGGPNIGQPVGQTISIAIPASTVISDEGPRKTKPRYKPKAPAVEQHFKRATVRSPKHPPKDPDTLPCLACKNLFGPHELGDCPLKKSGPEYCNFCGMAHFGYQRTCPHLHSETQVRLMLEALKNSPEDPELVRQAKIKLQGIKGTIIQKKKRQQIMQQAQLHQRTLPPGSGPAMPLGETDANRQHVNNVAQYHVNTSFPARPTVPGGIFNPNWSPLTTLGSTDPIQVGSRAAVQHTAHWQILRSNASEAPHGYTPAMPSSQQPPSR